MSKPALRTLWIIGGANGVGKTRYAREHIQQVTGSRRFVNLDEIARGLSPFDPVAEQVAAARIVLSRLNDFIEGRHLNGNPVVTLETTLSGRTYLQLIARARRFGARVNLLYFAVANASICVERVKRRVAEGGHHVAEEDIHRRFDRSVANFHAYAALSSHWRVFDNNDSTPRSVAEGVGSIGHHLSDALEDLPQALTDQLKEMNTPA
ncbi:MAG: AAA family ATPase [Ahrensia sp.]|nr:AAA family ATPase [Ahrensia sp.]